MTGSERHSGEEKLKAAIARLRKKRSPRPPINLDPTTPFEQAILHHYEELRRDVEDLKKRVDWLTVAIVGAALTFVLETIFSR